MKKEELQLVEKMLHKVTKEIISEEISQEENTKQEMQERIVGTIVKEQRTVGRPRGGKTGKTPGITITDKVRKEDGKENTNALKAIEKKLKKYLDFENNSNPEFPHQNNSPVDPKSGTYKYYRNDDAQQEYIDDFRGGGLEDLEYDTEPSDEFKDRVTKYLEGSPETGNAMENSEGEAYGNVVPSDLGKRVGEKAKRKAKKLKDVEGIPNDWNFVQKSGFIASESNTKKGKQITEDVNVDVSTMKHLFEYNKKTQ
jgi:hypothetical protein|tara:strand:+ start:4264 stop:5028 length:765 start_codon:yes stop_codon:yes gene_type:complete